MVAAQPSHRQVADEARDHRRHGRRALLHDAAGRHRVRLGTDPRMGSAASPRDRLADHARVGLSSPISPKASEVEIRFTPEPGGGTRVDLDHRHFERMGHGRDDAHGRERTGGWSGLLELFKARTTKCGSDAFADERGAGHQALHSHGGPKVRRYIASDAASASGSGCGVFSAGSRNAADLLAQLVLDAIDRAARVERRGSGTRRPSTRTRAAACCW